MNNLEEHKLIDYLYGRLQGEEKLQVEEYLKNNPDVKKELEDLRQTRDVLGKLEDREVIVPDMFNDRPSTNSDNSVPYLKTIIAVAASFLIIMFVGYFTRLNVSVANNQLTLKFGDIEDAYKPQQLTEDDLKTLIVEAFEELPTAESNNQISKAQLEEWLKAYDQKRQQNLTDQWKQFVSTEKRALKTYADELQASTLNQLNSHFATASIQQGEYVEDVLLDFTRYMDEQRLQDRQFYINNLVDLKFDTDLQQQETEQMLTSIINKVNNLPNENETQNF